MYDIISMNNYEIECKEDILSNFKISSNNNFTNISILQRLFGFVLSRN